MVKYVLPKPDGWFLRRRFQGERDTSKLTFKSPSSTTIYGHRGCVSLGTLPRPLDSPILVGVLKRPIQCTSKGGRALTVELGGFKGT